MEEGEFDSHKPDSTAVVNNVDYVLIVISRYFLIFEDFLRHMITRHIYEN